jgi:nicotinamidase/pyrazinamidase
MRLLIVVDMQNDFAHPDGSLFGGKSCRDIIPFIIERINIYKENNHMVILSMDTHEKEDKQFSIWKPHCIEGTWGWSLIDELLDVAVGCTIVRKKKFSVFYKTNLDSIVDVENVEVEVVGIFTSMCVIHTITDLYNRDAIITVPRKGIADADNEAHTYSLKYIEEVYKANLI